MTSPDGPASGRTPGTAAQGRPGTDPDVGGQLRLSVPAALAGERLDRGLALLTGVSRATAARLVAGGRASIGGKPARTASRRLHDGELLEVDLGAGAQDNDPAREAPALGAPRAQGPCGEAAPLAIVYADADVVVVDKPAGLVVHPGAGNRQGTMVQELVALFPDIAAAGPGSERPGVVHRLDKGTSGLLVVARNEHAREALVAQMAARSVDRRYLALVHGVVDEDEGAVDAPLGRSQSERAKVAVVHGGKPARTRYWARARRTSPLPVTLLVCRLETGRTHQVRAHFAAIGHPVVGDERYGRPSTVSEVALLLPHLRRPWLHAARLGFVHPSSGQDMKFTSALPPDLVEALGTLGISEDDAVV